MHYYDRHPFTAAQAHHAAESVLYLIRNKRFFLHEAGGRIVYAEEDYTLHPEVFAEAIALNASHLEAHREARQQAQTAIQQFEIDHRIVAPKVPRGGHIVDYSRYTGGFEICRVYPLAAFSQHVPKSLAALEEQLYRRSMGDITEDDIAPKELRSYREHAKGLAKTIWEQLQAIEANNPDNNRCLVLLQSRVDMGGCDDKGDFAEGRVWDMQDFPFAVGYLLYTYSQEQRIVRHNHVVCSTSRKSHVNFQHWSESSESGSKPCISYDKTDGYSSSVLFASVL